MKRFTYYTDNEFYEKLKQQNKTKIESLDVIMVFGITFVLWILFELGYFLCKFH